jgi:voltage-gated potassium channel
MPIFLIASRLVKSLGRYRELALIGLAVVIVLVGAGLFSLSEGVGYGLALYWSITTATTVGYGDVTPHNTAGRLIATGVMLTTIPIVGAVFALLAGASVLARIRRLFGMETTPHTSGYTVVYGSHPVLPRVLQELCRTGDPVVLVAPQRPPGVGDDVHFLAGDPTNEGLIRRSDPAQANRALIACTNDAETLVIAVAIHTMAPELEVFALTQSRTVARALHELGVTHTLSSEELVGHTLAKSLETPQAGSILLQLMDTENYRLGESPVDAALVSQPLSHARGTSGTLVLGIARDGDVDLGVGNDPVLAADDRLIVLEPIETK